jgi:general secretion pathway protein L
MSTLIVTLSSPGSSGQELAYCLVSNAQTISSHGSAALALLPRADETVLLLPSTAVAWHSVNLPKLPRSTSAQKMRAVIDGMVEEQLLDEPSTLHIAPYQPSASADSSTWLMVCDKAWLAQQLQEIRAAGHRISRIVPQAFPLTAGPIEDNATRVHISGTPEAATLSLIDSSGVLTVPLAHARAAWPALANDTVLNVTAEPAVAALAESTLGTKVAIVQSAQQALQAMLDARTFGVDLAQGDMTVAGSGRWLQQAGAVLRDLLAAPVWRTARIGFALLLLANVLGLNAWAWKESNALVAKRQLTTQLLTQTFPNVKVVVDAPVQMQRELGALRQSSGALGSRDLESMYARFATLAAITAAPSAIDFAAGELSIKGSGLAASQLSGLQDKLQNAGLAVRSEADRVIVSEIVSSRSGGAK